jgi:tetratricopeptide (TPR) repeat protein
MRGRAIGVGAVHVPVTRVTCAGAPCGRLHETRAASTVLGNRGANGTRLRQAFETTNRYLLAFFNAHVKGDASELAFLHRDPAANGAPAGLATIRELPAVRPAPSVQAFESLIAERGLDSAMKIFNEARVRDPKAQLFEETQLNRVGYRLLRTNRVAESVAFFKTAIQLYPSSANTYDSASEALEVARDTAQAVEVARKGLEVLERQQLSPADRRALRAVLEGRIKRLSVPPGS